MKQRLWVSVLALALLFLSPAWAHADGAYQGYLYDEYLDELESVNGYLYRDSLDGYDMGIEPFQEPDDLFVADDDTMYLVDTGNNRIIRFDRNGNVLRMFGDKEGKGRLNGPRGVFVTASGDVYAADTLNKRIAVFKADGTFVRDYPKPESPLLERNFTYTPSKLIVDKRGYLFVASDGTYQGLLQLDPEGTFRGFFGANKVKKDWKKIVVKWLATEEQKEQLARERPPSFSNLFQDTEGFIYTTTVGIAENQIKRLSAVGVDTLNPHTSKTYGDQYWRTENGSFLYPAFTDVTVDDKGVITALDSIYGKLFQYDKLGNLLFITGGRGEQNGLFRTAVSVDQASDGSIYVLDKARGRIDRFSITPFGQKVHEASRLYVEGFYDEAQAPWEEIRRLNSNYHLADFAIGKALYRQEKYSEAMSYFRKAKANGDYSKAFLEYRKEFVREHFTWFALGAILAYSMLKAWRALANRRKRQERRAAAGRKGAAL